MMSLKEVMELAKELHTGQMYKGLDLPYHHHCEAVRQLAAVNGYPEHIQQACLLHDTIEDTSATVETLAARGVDPLVIDLVWRVTDGEGKNRREKKQAMFEKCRGHREATLVKIFDRMANVSAAKAYNLGLFDMYVIEHPEFEEELHNYTWHDHRELWTTLRRMLRV